MAVGLMLRRQVGSYAKASFAVGLLVLLQSCSSAEMSGASGHNSANLTSKTTALGSADANSTLNSKLNPTLTTSGGSGTNQTGVIGTGGGNSQPVIASTNANGTAANLNTLGDNPPATSGVTPNTGAPLNPLQQAQAQQGIEKCLKYWGPTAPFNPNSTYKAVLATISVLGLGNPLNDQVATAAPELVVVFANIDLVTNVTWQLLNPNGYYCVLGAPNALSQLTIDLKQGAHLGSAAIALDVLSTTNNPGAASLNILADVNVVNVP